MKTSEVLNTAADLIEERGWVGRGGQGWLTHDGEPKPLCIEGAIAAAFGPGIDAYGGFTSGPNACPAGAAVREYLELAPFVSVSATPALFTWNDALEWTSEGMRPMRTAEQVIETLRAAAVIEAAKENTDTRAAVPA